MPPKHKCATPARYRDAGRTTNKRSRMVDETPESPSVMSPPVTVRDVPSEMDSLRQQMAEMTEQVTSIREVMLEIAARPHAPTLQHVQPSAAAGSAATAADEANVARDTPVMAGCTDFQPDISLYPTNMQSFSSVPLGSLVDAKLKSKIWANQFIELELLVGGLNCSTHHHVTTIYQQHICRSKTAGH